MITVGFHLIGVNLDLFTDEVLQGTESMQIMCSHVVAKYKTKASLNCLLLTSVKLHK